MRVTHRIKKMHVKRNSMENQAVSKYRKVERHLLCLNILSSVSKLKGPPKMSTVCKMWYCISSKSINIGKSVSTSKASPTNPDHIWDTFLCRENFVGMNAALSARTTLCETIHGFLICLFICHLCSGLCLCPGLSSAFAPSGLSDCLWARAPNLTNRFAAAPACGVILMWLRTLDFDSERKQLVRGAVRELSRNTEAQAAVPAGGWPEWPQLKYDVL